MQPITLRLVRPDDISTLQHFCWLGASLETVRARIAHVIARSMRGLGWGLVALVDGEPVGYGQLMHWGRRGEISDLVVREGWRGQGIGSAIVTRLLDIACQHGLQEVEIGAADSNPRAAALYRRLGFRDSRRVLLELGGGPEPVLYLSKTLREDGCE